MRNVLLAALVAAAAFAQQPEGGFERSLPVSGPVELDVRTDSGGIVVTPSAGSTVRVRAVLKGNRGRNKNTADIENRIRAIERNPPVEQTGSRIRVGYVSDRTLLKGISMRLEITTPVETRLRAHADSGGVRVQGISGPAECQTDSGGIEATGIGGGVRAQADSGGIRLRDIRGAVFARADSGGIDAINVAGAVDAQTDSGGIRIEQNTAAPVLARADSGGANVRLAPTAGYNVDVASQSGRITLPEMTLSGAFSRHRAAGKVRGGGPLVDVKVDSGEIVVQ
jgi:hypothetical protein